MESTFLPSKGNIASLQKEFPQLAKGHCFDLAEKDKAIEISNYSEDMVYLQGCGAILSTVNDLQKCNESLHVSKKVISDGLLAMMTTPHHEIVDGLYYGYGLIIQNNVIWHNAMIVGYRAELYYYPNLKVTSVSLNNLTFSFSGLKEGLKKAQEEEDSEQSINEYLIQHLPVLFDNNYYKESIALQQFLEGQCNLSDAPEPITDQELNTTELESS
jgi:hypothetical protein